MNKMKLLTTAVISTMLSYNVATAEVNLNK